MSMRSNSNRNTNTQSGAVALFIVLFAALLMTIVTMSFIQLMTGDQQQAAYSDLSQSAYDSAQAGVEDAKRALLMEQACKGDTSQRCEDIRTAVRSGQCNTLSAIFGNPADTETKIQQSAGDEKLNQGYTCVKIVSDTPNFLGSIDPNLTSMIVPIKATEAVSKITISWGLSKNGGTVDLPSGTNANLPKLGTSWPQNRPAVLRAQLINGKGNFNLSDFDKKGYSNTLFLYPAQAGETTVNFGDDDRMLTNAGNYPHPVKCSTSVLSGAYACSVVHSISPSIAAGSETIFLNLTALYNSTDFKIELADGSGREVTFNGVQPEIDSTGRADDLFRRVVSRVEMGGSFNYPQAAIEVTGNLCKNFSVTTEAGDFSNNCTP